MAVTRGLMLRTGFLALAVAAVALVASVFFAASMASAGHLGPRLNGSIGLGCKVNSSGKTVTLKLKASASGGADLDRVVLTFDGNTEIDTNPASNSYSATHVEAGLANGTYEVVFYIIDNDVPLTKTLTAQAQITNTGCRLRSPSPTPPPPAP